MPDPLNEIDWKETAALLAAIMSGGIIGRALLWPLFDNLVHKVLKEKLAVYDKAVKDVERLEERLHALEANQQLAASLESLHEDVEYIRELRGDEERGRRREGSPTMTGGRRQNDPPARKRE